MKRLPLLLPMLAVLFLLTGQGNALLVAGPDIIAAPASVADDFPPGAENFHQQAFNERQNVLLAAPLAVDGGFIPAGTVVSSHMIFLNTPGPLLVSDQGVVWTFNGPVLGVMSDTGGTLEGASNPLLGAPGTIYPGAFAERGIEIKDPLDNYLVAGNSITVGMHVTEPGDWMRVVTGRAPVPEPSTLLLLGTGLVGLVGYGRRRTRKG